jgi:hypothetical protein
VRIKISLYCGHCDGWKLSASRCIPKPRNLHLRHRAITLFCATFVAKPSTLFLASLGHRLLGYSPAGIACGKHARVAAVELVLPIRAVVEILALLRLFALRALRCLELLPTFVLSAVPGDTRGVISFRASIFLEGWVLMLESCPSVWVCPYWSLANTNPVHSSLLVLCACLGLCQCPGPSC